jgi:site-specific DNA recombinase
MTRTRDTKRSLDGYVRVSRVNGRDGDSYLSPSMQEDAIRRAAAQAGVKLGRIVREEDVSGATPVDERGLGQLIQRCESGESGGIITARHNRLGRSLLETATACKRLEAAGARYIAALDGIDTANPGARMTLGILAVIAEDEYHRRKEDWARVVSNRIGAGIYIAVQAPWGYLKEDGKLVPDEAVRPIVVELFHRRARGESLGRLCDWLNGLGVTPPGRARKDGRQRTGSRWAKSTVARVLSNRAYLGEARQGETVNPQAHDALVTQTEWDAANRKRQPLERRAIKGKAPLADRALLRGIAVCANCGHHLKVNNGDIIRATGERLPWYACSGRFQSGTCECRANVSGRELDPYVEALVLAAFQGDSPVVEAVQAQQELHAPNPCYPGVNASGPKAAAHSELLVLALVRRAVPSGAAAAGG